jgi:hypothetical protein
MEFITILKYNKTAEEEYANPAENLGFFLQKSILKVRA